VGFELLIGIRYLRSRRRERFISLIALISLAGVTIGTFTLTVVLSVMSGFEEDLHHRLLAFTPHVTVEKIDQSAWDSVAMQHQLAALPGVAGVAPFVTAQVMAVSGTTATSAGYIAGAVVQGVVADGNPVLTGLADTLTGGGSLATLAVKHDISVTDKGSVRKVSLPGAIVGKSLAQELGLKLGDVVTLISPTSIGAAADVPRLERFVVGGFFYSGMGEYDSSLVFVSLKDARLLLGAEGQLENGLELRVAHLFDAPQIARNIGAMLGPDYEVKDWTQTNASLFSALKLEKFTYFLVLLLIVLVAAFNIVATLVMVVIERRKEIAILRAMGARARSVAAIFLVEGAALGVVGTVIGVGCGFLASYLIGTYHLISLPADVFMVSSVPVRLYASNFIAVAVASVALCVAAGLYPAFQARSLSPVEVIRYE
jgi:lipoprotein-releasing system permease protein